MSEEKKWWEESPEEFVAGFSEEVQIRHASDFHPDFGELYKWSDFKKGETVSYRVAGAMRRGEIIWVSVGNGKSVPPHYWILPNGTGDSFPDMVLLSDVVMEKQQPPGMVEALEPCPYCYGQHPKGLIEQCPLKPH